jgi:thiopurine S-methyltransferase
MTRSYPPEYWDKFYREDKLGWDIGYVSTPLKEYFDQLKDKSIRILVPGAGNGWEVEYLYRSGFNNTFLLDFSKEAVRKFRSRFPAFPASQIITEDFFLHKGKYDLIVEQTFFSSLPRSMRKQYVEKCHELLNARGKWVGLLFNHEFGKNEPPFGGTPEEYTALFSGKFSFIHFETAYNSIKPRKGRELFILLLKN